MYDLDWNLLKSFLAVVETGSLTAAARQLDASQPTISTTHGHITCSASSFTPHFSSRLLLHVLMYPCAVCTDLSMYPLLLLL